MALARNAPFPAHYFFCGPEGSVDAEVPTAAELEGTVRSAVAGVLCDVGTTGSDLGALGEVVIALSGLSK